MALSGSLREFALSEVLQLLSSQRKTGSLRLTRGADTCVVYLLEGRIASMRDRGFGEDDPLARFLRRVHPPSTTAPRIVCWVYSARSTTMATWRGKRQTAAARPSR